MIKRFILYIITITTILLFTVTISAFASDPYPIDPISETQNGASEYQLQLLLQLIDSYNPYLNPDQKELVCKTILTEAQLTGFDPLFISSIIAAESSFHPKAVSPCKALGLMQLTSCVYKAMHIRDPFNIQENIYAGTRFLLYLKSLFSDSNLILAAYNAGPSRVARLGRVPRIRETLSYISKVNSLYWDLHQNFLALLKSSITQIQLCATLKAITGRHHSLQFAFYQRPANSNHSWNTQLYISESENSSRVLFIEA